MVEHPIQKRYLSSKIGLILFLLISFLINTVNAQDLDFKTAEELLTEAAKEQKGFNEKVEIDLTNLTADEIMSILAQKHKINLSVNAQFQEPLNTRFFDVTVLDVFLFLIDKYQLKVELSRGIVIINEPEELIIEELVEKDVSSINLKYNPQNKFLSLNVKNDSLSRVMQAISETTKANIILLPQVKGKLISAYILNRPLDDILTFIGKGNNLNFTSDSSGAYFVGEADKSDSITNNAQKKVDGNSSSNDGSKSFDVISDEYLSIDEQGFLSISVNDMSLEKIIVSAAKKSNVNYFLYDDLDKTKSSLKVTGMTFEELLDHLFSGKKQSYSYDDGLYVIGKEETPGIRKSKLIKMKNRTIENVLASIPSVFVESLELKEFVELNGVVATGNPQIIQELEAYLNQIDEIVPLVDIQVMIVQYQNGYDFTAGLELGVDNNTDRTNQGILNPGVTGTLNRSGVNKLIDVFNGFGVFNIGRVTDNFYLNLELLETNSIIKIHSTPRIASLSGHKATLSIGNTDYYFEQNNNLLTSNVTTDILQSGTWKSTDANLTVTIEPFVSTDENITLNIKVEQDSFTGRVAENAPPGKTTQNFESLVRVKNNEMILLGGLDEVNTENTGSGLPWISRVPVLNWIFGKRRKARNKSKLHVFIKPTVIY